MPDGTDRETLGMSVEVNHRFLDGIHLGRFYQTLQASIDALERGLPAATPVPLQAR